MQKGRKEKEIEERISFSSRPEHFKLLRDEVGEFA